ncbi:MAG: HU family DNA-binding protein [Leptolyngbya sp. SIOISBB]|nr:HU family DNA-binding protein [Leptolyngbya sp. SIOISBB]
MNRSELIISIAQQIGLNKQQADKALSAMTTSIIDAVKAGKDAQLVGFGTFSASKREQREGRNPRTREKMILPCQAS